MVSAEQLYRLCQTADPRIVDGIVKTAPAVFEKYSVNSARRWQHIIAQIAHESAGLTTTEENLNYSALRLTEVWETRFPTLTRAMPYAHNPKKLACYVYGNRLGNSGPEDGWLYRGQGLIQTTGRDNYAALARFCHCTLDQMQAKLSDPGSALECAVAQLSRMGLYRYADKDDIIGATKLIRGTSATTVADKRDLAARIALLTKAKRLFPQL